MLRRLLAGLALIALAPGASAQETVTYTYDALGRVVQATHAGTINSGVQTAYTLDPADNRINVTTTGASH